MDHLGASFSQQRDANKAQQINQIYRSGSRLKAEHSSA
ncbi:hypothetical protein EV13_1857 [Prochlorococcus sp. MIT 0702]|nr:hypothetical protein EV13_1857 [Prochlorococcus sp. MIT 0702]KGG29620.1 hypothetical protein EV12_0029 [Prochlorococcus sp. MIT 0701]KGG34381.1 hypothetical protein EV14_1277 [Prochlorococcus sp. MIT 0703]